MELEPPPKREANNAKPFSTSLCKYNSIRDAAQKTGIKEATIANRLRKGWNIDEALGVKPRERKASSRGIKIKCEGNSFNSIREMSDHYGVSFKRTWKRLNSNWTPEEAVGLSPKPPRFRNQDGSVRDHAWTGLQKIEGKDTVPVTKAGGYLMYLLKDGETKNPF